jgi:hypothetical protein
MPIKCRVVRSTPFGWPTDLAIRKHDDHSLRKMREVLKRADNLRQALLGSNDLPKALSNMYEFSGDLTTPVSEYSSQQNDGPVGKRRRKRSHLIRPNSLRIVRFPTG